MKITWYSYEVITKSRRSFHFLYGLMFTYNKEKRNIFTKFKITPTDQVSDIESKEAAITLIGFNLTRLYVQFFKD